MFEGFLDAMSTLASPRLIIFFLIGAFNGMLTGLLPGLSGSVGIALMLPLTYGIGVTEAVALFISALAAQNFSGSIGAILLNAPGSSPSAAATLDGYPLARQGRGGFAIGVSAGASALGSLYGVIFLVLMFPLVRVLVLSLGYPEYTMMALLGMTAIALASRGSLLKGLVSGAVGVMISFIGFSPIGRELRYAFGFTPLWSGVDILPLLVGLFAVAESMQLLLHGGGIGKDAPADLPASSHREVWSGVRYALSQRWLVLRSSLLGTGIGVVPGVGGTVASFLAYFQASRTCKDGHFGQGDPRGVLAPEAANDAKDAGSALPSLGFGIPGSADWAIVLGALVLHGVAPGPNLIRERPDIIWIAVVVILAASWLTSGLGLLTASYAVRLITRIRVTILAPVVGVLAIVGAYGVKEQFLDVFIAVAAGILGFYLRRYRFPVVPLILGLVLGAQMETWFLQSLSIYDQGIAVFVTRPVSGLLFVVIAGLLVVELVGSRRSARSSKRAQVMPELGDTALIALLGITGLVATWMAYRFNAPADLFPLITGWILVSLCALALAVATVPGLRRRYWTAIAGTSLEYSVKEEVLESVAREQGAGEPERAAGHERTAPEPDAEEPGPSTRRELAFMGVWVLLAVGGWVLGLPLFLPLFMIVMMWWFGKESIRTIAVTVTVTMLVLYTVFVAILNVDPGLGFLLN